MKLKISMFLLMIIFTISSPQNSQAAHKSKRKAAKVAKAKEAIALTYGAQAQAERLTGFENSINTTWSYVADSGTRHSTGLIISEGQEPGWRTITYDGGTDAPPRVDMGNIWILDAKQELIPFIKSNANDLFSNFLYAELKPDFSAASSPYFSESPKHKDLINPVNIDSWQTFSDFSIVGKPPVYGYMSSQNGRAKYSDRYEIVKVSDQRILHTSDNKKLKYVKMQKVCPYCGATYEQYDWQECTDCEDSKEESGEASGSGTTTLYGLQLSFQNHPLITLTLPDGEWETCYGEFNRAIMKMTNGKFKPKLPDKELEN